MNDMEKMPDLKEERAVETDATEQTAKEENLETTVNANPAEIPASAETSDSGSVVENTQTEENTEEKISEEDAECSEIVRSMERQKGFTSYLRDLVFGLAFVLLAFMLIFRVVVVSGPSMMDTLHDGDSLVLISNIFYRNPKQGDIVVATKDSFKDGEPIIKRVIATEGQTVDIDFDAGIVYVDGKPLDEPYTRTPTNYQEGMKFPLKVDEGCVFVMGDNRNDSLDSRSTQIGLIDRREILGRVLFLALPGREPFTQKRDFSRIGVLK